MTRLLTVCVLTFLTGRVGGGPVEAQEEEETEAQPEVQQTGTICYNYPCVTDKKIIACFGFCFVLRCYYYLIFEQVIQSKEKKLVQ